MKFTQEDLDRVAGSTRQQGATAEANRILEALGVKTLEEAQEVFTERRAAEEAGKTEVQRLQEANAALERERDAEKLAAAQFRVTTEVSTALKDAGINPKRVEGAMKLASLDGVTVGADGALEGVAAVVAKIKEDTPEWFGATFTPPPTGEGSPSVNAMDMPRDEYQKLMRDQYGVRI